MYPKISKGSFTIVKYSMKTRAKRLPEQPERWFNLLVMGEHLQFYRKLAGYKNTRDLAAALKSEMSLRVSKGTIDNYEQGKHEPTLRFLVTFCMLVCRSDSVKSKFFMELKDLNYWESDMPDHDKRPAIERWPLLLANITRESGFFEFDSNGYPLGCNPLNGYSGKERAQRMNAQAHEAHKLLERLKEKRKEVNNNDDYETHL